MQDRNPERSHVDAFLASRCKHLGHRRNHLRTVGGIPPRRPAVWACSGSDLGRHWTSSRDHCLNASLGRTIAGDSGDPGAWTNDAFHDNVKGSPFQSRRTPLRPRLSGRNDGTPARSFADRIGFRTTGSVKRVNAWPKFVESMFCVDFVKSLQYTPSQLTFPKNTLS